MYSVNCSFWKNCVTEGWIWMFTYCLQCVYWFYDLQLWHSPQLHTTWFISLCYQQGRKLSWIGSEGLQKLGCFSVFCAMMRNSVSVSVRPWVQRVSETRCTHGLCHCSGIYVMRGETDRMKVGTSLSASRFSPSYTENIHLLYKCLQRCFKNIFVSVFPLFLTLWIQCTVYTHINSFILVFHINSAT